MDGWRLEDRGNTGVGCLVYANGEGGSRKKRKTMMIGRNSGCAGGRIDNIMDNREEVGESGSGSVGSRRDKTKIKDKSD